MQLGVIGLGRMGRIVVDRVLEAGHDVVAFDLDESAVIQPADELHLEEPVGRPAIDIEE